MYYFTELYNLLFESSLIGHLLVTGRAWKGKILFHPSPPPPLPSFSPLPLAIPLVPPPQSPRPSPFLPTQGCPPLARAATTTWPCSMWPDLAMCLKRLMRLSSPRAACMPSHSAAKMAGTKAGASPPTKWACSPAIIFTLPGAKPSLTTSPGGPPMGGPTDCQSPQGRLRPWTLAPRLWGQDWWPPLAQMMSSPPCPPKGMPLLLPLCCGIGGSLIVFFFEKKKNMFCLKKKSFFFFFFKQYWKKEQGSNFFFFQTLVIDRDLLASELE